MTAIRKDIPFREYLAHKAENNSGLKHMAKSPKEYLYRKTHGREDTEALSIGRHIHTAVLEPELFDGGFTVWSGGETAKGEFSMSKNTAAYKTFLRESANAGLEVLSEDEIATCRSVADAVYENPDARAMLEQADAEVSIFWQHRFGIACKMRADLLRERGPHPFLADLKSAQDASPDGFARAAAKYGYHIQLGMYREGVYALTGKLVPVYIIAVEKVPPFDCAVYEVPEAALDVGRSIFEERLMRVVKCRESGMWPGAQVGVGTLELPNWVFEEDAGVLDWEGIAV